MLTWDIETIVTSTVESIFPKFSPPEKGLKVSLEIHLATYGDNGEVFYATRILELIFQRPSNYTKVFARILKGNRKEVQRDWLMTCDHDSCWRTDGMEDLFKLYMEVRDEMEKLNPGWNNKRRSEVSITAARGMNFLEWGTLLIEADTSKMYRYNLKSFTTDKN